jgi:galactokinase
VAGVETLIRAATGWADGARLLIRSDVPVGGGLSSSAALEVSAALALARLAGLEIRGTDLADLARRAEHEFARVPCGIMDQYVSVLAKAGHAFLLDCRDRSWEHVPLRLGGAAVLVVNSGVRHALAAGEYAARQRECQQALAFFRQLRPDVRALRDVTPADVRQNETSLGPLLAARARHVTSENERTLAAAAAIRAGNLAELGQLLHASHRSLRDDHQVSCPELDRLVDILSATRSVYGARMTGAGFGGCVVAVVESAAVPAAVAAVRRDYDAAGFGPAEVILSQPGDGASVTCRAVPDSLSPE